MNKEGRLNILLLLTLTALGMATAAFSAEPGLPMRTLHQVVMAAEFELVLHAPRPDTDPESLADIGNAAFAAMAALESRISRWQPDSDISRVNRLAGEKPVAVPPDVFRLIRQVQEIHRETQGAFDVTVGPLLELWGFYTKQERWPDEAALKQTLERVGLTHVQLNEQAHSVAFDRPGMSLDFGGIGKGLALDYAANVLRDQGIVQARLHGGTSTYVALGAPPEKAGWTVDIESPYNKQGPPIATVEICDESLSTSARSDRYVEKDGKRYGHIFDPRTGLPTVGVASATAIAPTGVESDALSTAFYVMGVDAVRAYCEKHRHVRAILAVENGEALETIYINFDNDMTKEQS